MTSSNPLQLLQKDSTSKILETKLKSATKPSDSSRIRCPLCKWQPKKSDQWQCSKCGPPEKFSGGCFTAWHTFDTRGKCPGCKHQWTYTVCLSCRGWSLHEDWYVKTEDLN